MVRIHFKVEGDAHEVVRFLGRLGGEGGETGRVLDGRQNPASEPAPAASTPATLSGGWTEELAGDFTVGR